MQNDQNTSGTSGGGFGQGGYDNGTTGGKLGGYLRKLRAPAVRFTYTMQKEFISDLDKSKQSGNSSGASGSSASSGSSGASGCTDDACPIEGIGGSPSSGDSSGSSGGSSGNSSGSTSGAGGQQPCSMTESGCVTVRFSDLAVIATVMMLCCGCMKMCRK